MNAYRIACIALLLSAVTASAAEPTPGEYISDRGWGTLNISRNKGGKMGFSISSIGANGHSCSLEGAIRDGEAVLSNPAPGSSCHVSFEADQGGIDVILGQPDDCRDYCGMRATFDGRYAVPAAGCHNSERKATQAKFSQLYKSQDYDSALPVLQTMLNTCAGTLFWLEEAQIRNDLAVTYHHLQRNEECLAVVQPTINAYGTTEKEIQEALPPSDAESILPLAKAAWFNAKLCGK